MMSPPYGILFYRVILILYSIAILSSASVSATEFIFNTDFTFSNLSLFGNATIQSNSVLSLTSEVSFSVGRALYPFKIPITTFTDSSKSKRSSFSFATSFIFSISPVRNFLPGHGFAFLFTPFSGINGTTTAQHLGLFNFTNNGSPNNHVFAVEFDSFKNQEFDDINDNHVGLDLNSLKSNASSVAGFWDGEDEFEELKLNNGENYQVWIQCVNSLVNVTMARAGVKRPQKPLITQLVDFSELLLDEMYVGFTASTGQLIQTHRILAWSFSTTNLSIGDALITENLPSFVLPNEPIFKSKAFIVSLTLGCSFIIAMAILVYVILIKWRKKRKQKAEDIEDWEVAYWPHRFPYEDVYEATNGFSDAKVIGFGGNGKVYKGLLGAANVAVKRISLESESGMTEFLAEISSLGRLKHINLVKLIGWCKKEKGSLILIYDYMENGSLDKKLFQCGDNEMLRWDQRMKALKDVAAGLMYLHHGWECTVLHRDIKANNVLLDKDMNAKLGDFGLARIHRPDQFGNTTQVVGTVGYMAPEVVKTGRVSVEADVFGFGVLVLEMVCGRRSIEEGKPWLIDWVRRLMEKDELGIAFDERLRGKSDGYNIQGVEKVIYLGLLCTNSDPSARPTMQQVVKILDEISEDESGNRLLKRLKTLTISLEYGQSNNGQPYPTFEDIKMSTSSTSLSGSDIISVGR